MSSPDLTPLHLSPAQLAQMLVPSGDGTESNLDTNSSAATSAIMQQMLASQSAPQQSKGYKSGGRAKLVPPPGAEDLLAHRLNNDPAHLAAALPASIIGNFRQPAPALPAQATPPSGNLEDTLQDYDTPEGQQYIKDRGAKHASGGMVSLHDMLNPPNDATDPMDTTLQGMAHGGEVRGKVGPTDAQKHAGNYKKDHVRLHGLAIAIENRAGTERTGKSKSGHEWSVKMPVHYGYIKKTEGADGDHVDTFIGPHKSDHVHVIDQVHHDDPSKFDEHKVMMGFHTMGHALDAYHSSFSDGKGPSRVGAITPMHIDDFKHWLKHGDTKKPMVKHMAKHFAAGGSVGRNVPANGHGVSTFIGKVTDLNKSIENNMNRAGKTFDYSQNEDQSKSDANIDGHDKERYETPSQELAKGGRVSPIMAKFKQPIPATSYVQPVGHYRDNMGNQDLSKIRSNMRVS